MDGFISKLLDFFSKLSRKNEDQHVYVIVVGLAAATTLSIFLIGRDNIRTFFQQFSRDIMGSGVLAISLFTANSVLAVLFVIAGLLELNASRDRFAAYIPEPPKGAWILNVLVCILITFQLYTSITNILQYCIVYIVFTFVDFYFRYAISASATKAIEGALKNILRKKANEEHLELDTERQYRMLLEGFVHYRRYPMLCIVIIRMLLAVSALALVVVGKYADMTELDNYAYVNMIYCIILNEVFSWGYRIKFIGALNSAT